MNYGLVPFQCLETAKIRPKIADLFEMPASYLDVTAGKLDPAQTLEKFRAGLPTSTQTHIELNPVAAISLALTANRRRPRPQL